MNNEKNLSLRGSSERGMVGFGSGFLSSLGLHVLDYKVQIEIEHG